MMRWVLSLAFGLALEHPAVAVEHHYAPAENLEMVDVAAIGRATRTIDMAAYVLTDVAVIEALAAAGRRGVAVRVYFDPGQADPHGAVAHALLTLAQAPNVVERTKLAGPLMHLKAYCVDVAVLRTGSANFSASGLKHQDNELTIDHDSVAAKVFEDVFERMWRRPD